MKAYILGVISLLVIWTTLANGGTTDATFKCDTIKQERTSNETDDRECFSIMSDSMKTMEELVKGEYNCSYFWSVYLPGHNCSLQYGCGSYFEVFLSSVTCEAPASPTPEVTPTTEKSPENAASRMTPNFSQASSTIAIIIISQLLNNKMF
ncbi:uncharacterized protein LOC106871584 [Octopus bimaculoides]|uniref:SEA domain-containing protein n=1 Tax=Octopus bimaculoides TaxID=37653 RepID=A0A0L8HC16_OCTBM|nr:uncharacterized protein LOC106871584 [Octopus bimaculoides]|eukprot:XP_014773579.1 PREDICTED: uncharacterized protein LOC106871584 [Octopus bimaculoides]